MEEDNKKFSWITKLDWLNILSMLNLETISQIPEFKKDKAIKRISKFFSIEQLLEFEPAHLDKLVANELKELMKKELLLNEKKQEKMERELRNKIVPFDKGSIIKIDPKDFDGDPNELIKYFKKFFGDDDDSKDDDRDTYKEDNSSYYI